MAGRSHSGYKVRSVRVVIDDNTLSYKSDDEVRGGLYIAADPLTPEHSYFEIELLDVGKIGAITVGLVHKDYDLCQQPGWADDSIGYHADDGKLYQSCGRGSMFGPKCDIGDRMGCGIKFDQIEYEEGSEQKVPVFFTRNGEDVGTIMYKLPRNGFFPATGLNSEGEKVRLKINAGSKHIVADFMAPSCESKWGRLIDVLENNQVLEYDGDGISIADVGMAQAMESLSITNHYYEIEIVDPGEKCYIAMGLAHCDYPEYRHLGWDEDSIAYHADDGKIYKGCGQGEEFGPACNEGDIMGCGIKFPKIYVTGMHCNVQVFFKRNGKTVGTKCEVRLPDGGFFPTITMLSSDEKVKVDLNPTGG